MLKKQRFVILAMLILGISGCSDKSQGTLHNTENNRKEQTQEQSSVKEEQAIKKGYDLPVDESERKEAEADCKSVMELISDIYVYAEKGDASNVVISDEAVHQMVEEVKKTECPVTDMGIYSNVENYEKVETFLKTCEAGKSGSIILYKIRSDGGMGREKYMFDGTDMYVLAASASWNEESKPVMTYISYNRIKEWKYTGKGWFCYELCVPEFPEVSEVVDGSCMLRVRPMKAEYQDISKRCLLPLGYQGNNLLCSNWDAENLEDLDYNGMFEYLYRIKYQEKFQPENYPKGSV